MELFKLLPLFVLAASTLAFDYGYNSHEGYQIQGESIEDHHGEYDVDYHAHPKYSFDYSVKDPHTGDDKEHWETRDGDKVKGQYTVLETDGTKRVVEYEADDKNGFNAVVHKIGTPKHDYKASSEEKGYIKQVYNYQEASEEFKPVYEGYHNEHQQLEEGFVPIAGSYEH
ncbi:uncharacterized protein LOC116773572 [Danaus plexippus]|uniref:uncharacterized protein LOC116773572 n=1 Tax=Danaus plexippus TaxID=13037 RepID=UPI0013C51DED|nr:uncharacterized protein LOC116773572 [Danaus plexippus]